MPDLTITYKCGHEQSWRWPKSGAGRPFKNNAHRDQMIAEAVVGYCPDCARQRINASTAREAVLDGLTPLAGTPKQVAWANTIRAESADRIASEIASEHYLQCNDLWPSRVTEAFYAEIEALRAKYPTYNLAAEVTRRVAEADNAVWWIECGSARDLAEIALNVLRNRDERGPVTAPVAPILAPEAV